MEDNNQIDKSYVIPDNAKQYYTFSAPKYSDWQLHITSNFVIVPLEGEEPNWFFRKMQEIILGVKWKKVEKS